MLSQYDTGLDGSRVFPTIVVVGVLQFKVEGPEVKVRGQTVSIGRRTRTKIKAKINSREPFRHANL